jgi:hypothetical protein
MRRSSELQVARFVGREDPIAHGNRPRTRQEFLDQRTHLGGVYAEISIRARKRGKTRVRDVIDEELRRTLRLEIMFSDQHEGRGLDEREGRAQVDLSPSRYHGCRFACATPKTGLGCFFKEASLIT